MDYAKIEALVDQALEDITQALEEDRHYPSVREAGDAPTDYAMDNAQGLLDDLIEKISLIDGPISMTKVRNGLGLDELIDAINLDNYQGFRELTHVENFTTDNGERKYNYVTHVFLHATSGKHLGVEIQECARSQEDLSLVNVAIIEKKETVVVRWV